MRHPVKCFLPTQRYVINPHNTHKMVYTKAFETSQKPTLLCVRLFIQQDYKKFEFCFLPFNMLPFYYAPALTKSKGIFVIDLITILQVCH